jgi:hypothetical protein
LFFNFILASKEMPLNLLDDLTEADEFEKMFVDSGNYSYLDDDLNDILSESDEEILENESGSQNV